MSEPQVFTMGHSNHAMDELLAMLVDYDIRVVVDVRSDPFPKYATWFERSNLDDTLKSVGLDYVFMGHLLGGRPRDPKFYDHEGYVRYDWLAESEPFLDGLNELVSLITSRRVVVMCSEENPAECHRRLLIGRVLAQRGVSVSHIRADGRVQTEVEVDREHRVNSGEEMTLSLFDTSQEDVWRSTRSVSGRNQRRTSSQP